MVKPLYILLKQHLESKIPEADIVQWYLQQYNMMPSPGDHESEGNKLLNERSIFIEFLGPINPETMQNRIQQAEIRFRVHLVDVNLYEDDQRITDPALAHLELADKVYDKLQDHSALLSSIPGNESLKDTEDDQVIFNGCTRVAYDTDHSFQSLFVTKMDFETLARDFSAVPGYAQVLADANVTGSYQ